MTLSTAKLLLIDNIGDNIKKSSVCVFADDTKATRKIASIDDAEILL